MAIYKSSNHSPNLQEIDLTENNTFSCVVNTSGESVKAYKMTILSEDGTDTIADGYYTDSYNDGATNLTIPLNNKGILKIPNVSSNFHKPNMALNNGNNYQWGVRTYNAVVSSPVQPNTQVCEGYLVGSTKYVIWSIVPADIEITEEMTPEQKAEAEALNESYKIAKDQLVYDRYVEVTVNNENELVKGAHESSDKVKPKNYPYTQRKKIDWVSKDIGNEKDFVKIETTENFDFDYLDGKPYTIYKCSSDHTVKSAFADPNTNINAADYIIIYNSVTDAKAAFDAGDTPEEIKSSIVPFGTSRKITGYSSDTGEIRVQEAWPSAPNNECAYRAFEYDVIAKTYKELFSSDLIYKVKSGSVYYTLLAPVGVAYYESTVPSGTKYYSLSGSTTTEVGTLTAITSCYLKGSYTIAGTLTVCSDITLTTYTAPVGTKLYDKTVGKVDYYSDPELQNKIGTLTADSTPCTYISESVSSIYKSDEGKTYFVATTSSLNELLSTDTDVSCTRVTDTYSEISFKRESASKTCYIKTNVLVKNVNNYIVPTVKKGDLAEETSYTFKNSTYSTVKVGTKSYQLFTIPGGAVGSEDNYVASNVTAEGGTIVVGGTTCQVSFASLNCYIGKDAIGNPFEAQKIGGRPITNQFYKIVTNRWDTTGQNQVHRLFIQPNINVKPDLSNPDEIVFANGVRINIVEQYWTNNNKRVDITFNKLDNSQWLLEDSPKNEHMKPGGLVPVSITDDIVIPSGQTVPTISQTDYKIFTDFSDSMPYNIFYARKVPEITLQFRNALKNIVNGKLVGGDFYDESGNKITSPSGMVLYYDVSANKYYEWIKTHVEEGQVISDTYEEVCYNLYEGLYNSEDDEFEKADGTIIPKSADALYLDVLTGIYYRCVNNAYQITTNKKVVWYDVNSEVIRDFREVEFRALWEDSSGNTAIDPQIKNYQYTLYAYDYTYSNKNFVKESITKYNIDTLWTFRGLDGTPTSEYSYLNPHKYNVSIKITDEYDKEYIVSSDFKVFYNTENAPTSIKVNYLCDEQANQIDISPPAYAQSTDYTSGETTYHTITDEDINKDTGIATIGAGKTLNYTNVSSSGIALTFPKTFCMLAKVQLTDAFIDKKSNRAEILRVSHSLEDTKYTIVVGKTLYNQVARQGIAYYSDRNFSQIVGTLPLDRPYTLRKDTVGEYGTLTLTDSNLTVYYINVESDTKAGISTSIITNKDTGVSITVNNEIYSSVILEQQVSPFDIGNYYIFTDDLEVLERNEEFAYKIDVSGMYNTSSNSTISINSNCYNLYLYKKESDTQETQELACFQIDGVSQLQDHINLMGMGGIFTPSLINAIQYNPDSTTNTYEFCETLIAAQNANPNKKYVLVNDSGEYLAGVYVAIQPSSGQSFWQQVVDEDYIFVTNTNEVDGATYETLRVPEAAQGSTGTTGEIKWYDDGDSAQSNINYYYITNGEDQSPFKNYIRNKTLNLFLRVEYDDTKNPSRIIRTQVSIT